MKYVQKEQENCTRNRLASPLKVKAKSQAQANRLDQRMLVPEAGFEPAPPDPQSSILPIKLLRGYAEDHGCRGLVGSQGIEPKRLHPHCFIDNGVTDRLRESSPLIYRTFIVFLIFNFGGRTRDRTLGTHSGPTG